MKFFLATCILVMSLFGQEAWAVSKQAKISSYLFKISIENIDDPTSGANYDYNGWGSFPSGRSYCDGYQGGHAGIDVQTKDVVSNHSINRKFYSLSEGVVIKGGGGTYNTIAVYNSEVNQTVVYLHAKSVSVDTGDTVKIGDLLGIQGDMGAPGAFHVHVEVSSGKTFYAACGASGTVDPEATLISYLNDSAGSSSGGSSGGTSGGSSSSSSRVILAEVNATSSYYDIYTWYYKNKVLNIVSNRPVQDTDPYSVSETKRWFSGKIRSGTYDDILTSFTQTNYRDGDDYRLFYVYNSNGNGDFDGDENYAEKWKEKKESNVDKVFLSDADNDGLADLILSNKNSEGNFEWKICTNKGNKFEDDCDDWDSSEDGKTFGDADDVMLAGDFNGNGKAELIRGRFGTEDCPDGLKWRRMTSGGTVSTVKDCWGYPEEVASGGNYQSQYLVGNIDSDAADELIQIRISNSGTVQAYKANFNSDTEDFDTSSWTSDGSDIGGASGWYYLADVDNDGDSDLVRWSAEGNIVWMKNENGVLKKAKNTLLKNRSRGDDDILLFGNFGKVSGSTSSASFIASAEASPEDETDDSDGDGLIDLAEYYLGTDSWDVDSDADSFSDFDELKGNSDPDDPTDIPAFIIENDDDKDGLTNEEELLLGTDPLDFDTDDDGYSDYDELRDDDGDGLTNAKELSFGTDPNSSDTDLNGLTDYQEYLDFLYSSYSVGGAGCSFRVE